MALFLENRFDVTPTRVPSQRHPRHAAYRRERIGVERNIFPQRTPGIRGGQGCLEHLRDKGGGVRRVKPVVRRKFGATDKLVSNVDRTSVTMVGNIAHQRVNTVTGKRGL